MRCASAIAYLPEDRKTDGLFLDLSVTDNVTAASLSKVARRGIYSRARSERTARSAIAALGIKAPDPAHPVRELSGGNQQKTLLARWLETNPEIIIVDEPTRGVDVAAKHEIHAMLARLAENGAGILVISSDLIELIALADRILVMHAGPHRRRARCRLDQRGRRSSRSHPAFAEQGMRHDRRPRRKRDDPSVPSEE